MNIRRLVAATLLASTAGAGALAQQTTAPVREPVRGLEQFGTTTPTPAPGSTIPVPAAPVIALPTPTPEPAPPPIAPPRPAPSERRSTPRPSPTPAIARPAEAPVTRPVAIPSPIPTTGPAAGTPAPIATPEPEPTPPAVATPAAEPASTWPSWLWLVALGAVIAAIIAFALRRRATRPLEESTPIEEEWSVAPPVEAAPATPQPAMLAPPPPLAPPPEPTPAITGDRARLEFTFTPRRAGLNMVTATLDCELTITNTGTAPAESVRIHPTMLSAHTGQDTEIAALFGHATGRPSVAPFGLAPGETRTVRSIVSLHKEAIRPITAGGRALFVPIVAVNIVYAASPGVEGQTAQAFAIGIEREAGAKLAPFRLDVAPSPQDVIVARAHAPATTR